MAAAAVLRLLVTALTAACCVHAISLAGSCGGLTSCEECYSSGAACGWCSTASSPAFHCVSLTAAHNSSASCRECGKTRLAREGGSCDDTTCLGVEDELCSGHGKCTCGTCTCEPGYSGRACQNCPSKWDNCPSSSDSCCDLTLCLSWQAGCARCMRNERNATLCDTCPRDTLLVTTDPGLPQSSECVFDSLSISANMHCSFHVYYWRDEPLLAMHARVQLTCGPAKTIFQRPDPAADTAAAAPDIAAAAPDIAAAAPDIAAAAPDTAAAASSATTDRPSARPEKEVEAAPTERPEGASKLASAAAPCQAALLLLCCLGAVCGLK